MTRRWRSCTAQPEVLISAVTISNSRSLDHAELILDPLTILVGANGTGRSSVLHALRFFFEATLLEPEDVSYAATGDASLRVTFTALNAKDRETLGEAISGETLVLERRWNLGASRLLATAMRYRGFAPVRNAEGARASRSRLPSLASSEQQLHVGFTFVPMLGPHFAPLISSAPAQPAKTLRLIAADDDDRAARD